MKNSLKSFAFLFCFLSLPLLLVSQTCDTLISLTLCPNESIEVAGNIYDENNQMGSELLTGVNGCDSIINVDLSFHDVIDKQISQEVCVEELPIIFENMLFAEGGVYEFEVIDSSGCPLSVTLDLTVFPVTPDEEITAELCENELPFIGPDNLIIDQTGVYIIEKIDSNGCSFMCTIILIVLESQPDIFADFEICGSELPFVWQDSIFEEAGTYEFEILNSNGCSFNNILNLSIIENSESPNQTIYATDTDFPFEIEGQEIFTYGDYCIDPLHTCFEKLFLSVDRGATIQGTVTTSENFNCEGLNRKGTNGVQVKIFNDSSSYSVFVDPETGEYKKGVPAGDYTVQPISQNNIWEFCEEEVDASLALQEIINLDFTAESDIACSAMETYLSPTKPIRRCFDTQFMICSRNTGILTALDAYVDIFLQENYTFLDASTDDYAQDGQTVTVQLGDIAPGQNKIFYISLNVSCESVLGETHCLRAEVFPQENCTELFSQEAGPFININGECLDDKITFDLTNPANEDMVAESGYTLSADGFIVFQGQVQLAANETQTLEFDNTASLFRMQVSQPSTYPFTDCTEYLIENCTAEDVGSDFGFVDQTQCGNFPYHDTHCADNIGSWDPNDIAVTPSGYKEQHWVENNQTLHYRIRFQNTGSDTAFNIKILDTIPSELNLETFDLQGYSHRPIVSIEDNLLRFDFNNIQLVDSVANEPLSHGFVSFQIEMMPDLVDDIVIENLADIYFDFNEPVRTNTSFLTIGTDFLDVILSQEESYLPKLKISPNPLDASGELFLDMEIRQSTQIQLISFAGVQMFERTINDNVVELSGQNLMPGLYILKVLEKGKVKHMQKLILH